MDEGILVILGLIPRLTLILFRFSIMRMTVVLAMTVAQAMANFGVVHDVSNSVSAQLMRGNADIDL